MPIKKTKPKTFFSHMQIPEEVKPPKDKLKPAPKKWTQTAKETMQDPHVQKSLVTALTAGLILYGITLYLPTILPFGLSALIVPGLFLLSYEAFKRFTGATIVDPVKMTVPQTNKGKPTIKKGKEFLPGLNQKKAQGKVAKRLTEVEKLSTSNHKRAHSLR